ncbi:hypothetical protein NDU88_001180 [Pleurodeles waltl]|uniref:Uncharacterized protein n=1 Tax=Pleurodeles waltl TaxID=8319 RepID=A0AAV7S6P9_PLEWA|nr:hypothetical protein NDU88_001180 [Pleurodeles waltl]
MLTSADTERTNTLWEDAGGVQRETERRKSKEVERQERDEEREDGVLQKKRPKEIRRKEEKGSEQRKERQELKGSPEITDPPGEDPKGWTHCNTSCHVPGGAWLSQLSESVRGETPGGLKFRTGYKGRRSHHINAHQPAKQERLTGYIRMTTRKVRIRIHEHWGTIRCKRDSTKLVSHRIKKNHSADEMEWLLIERLKKTSQDMTKVLL